MKGSKGGKGVWGRCVWVPGSVLVYSVSVSVGCRVGEASCRAGDCSWLWIRQTGTQPSHRHTASLHSSPQCSQTYTKQVFITLINIILAVQLEQKGKSLQPSGWWLICFCAYVCRDLWALVYKEPVWWWDGSPRMSVFISLLSCVTGEVTMMSQITLSFCWRENAKFNICVCDCICVCVCVCQDTIELLQARVSALDSTMLDQVEARLQVSFFSWHFSDMLA